jgi:hypothetical protein
VAFLKTDVSEEYFAFLLRVKRISEIGTTLAVTSNRSTLSLQFTLVAANAAFAVYAFLANWKLPL